jgi:UDP-2,4-diacetamido-2,4,6-trideoxy-beta-L-altropyranose hydrolase
MKVAIRADASLEIGSGHIARCLTLALGLRTEMNAEVVFLSRPAPGDLFDRIAWAGFRVFPVHATEPLEDARETASILDTVSGVDWLVVDHYGLGSEWEAAARSARRVLVIDDLADRAHDCDILLNQMPLPDAVERYRGLLPAQTRLLAGPAYALLRPAFARVHDDWRPPSGRVRRVLVSFGGTDPPNMTGRVLEALAGAGDSLDIDIDVVATLAMPQIEELRRLTGELPRTRLHVTVDMAELMASADLSVGACGMTALERCCAGLPSLVVSIADNQVPNARELAALRAVEYLGTDAEVTRSVIREALWYATREPERIRRMAEAAYAITDGRGTQRVMRAMQEAP